MQSALPKVLHPVCGRALSRGRAAARRPGASGSPSSSRPIGFDRRPFRTGRVRVQPESNGTGGAVRRRSSVVPRRMTVLVLSGDVPLVSRSDRCAARRARARGRRRHGDDRRPRDPGSYGRVVRGEGRSETDVDRIVEAKAGRRDSGGLALSEINSGIYVFAAARWRRRWAGSEQRQRAGRVLPARRAAVLQGPGPGGRRPRLRGP